MDRSILVRNYKKEDIDYIIERHRVIYDKEYGFSSEFMDYVEKYVKEFDKNHDEAMENIWIAETGGKRVGMIAIAKAEEDTAQLRWFLIEPEMRGKGLGRRLMKTAVDFCKEKVKELGGCKITIGIIEENTVLRDWYAANGFVHTGTKKFDHMPFTAGFMEWRVG